MPIEGDSLSDAGQQFCNYLNWLLAKTISQRRLVLLQVRGMPSKINIAFREKGHGDTAKLKTRFGEIGLYIGLVCGATQAARGRFRLFVPTYRYSLTPKNSKQPLWRWEYVKDWPPGGRWCRHHLQGDIPVRVGQTPVSLNELHLPTGYVPVEELLRFCIVDMGVRPLSNDWHEILSDSYERFKGELGS